MADSYYSVARYVGATGTKEGEVSVGVNDEDTFKHFYESANIAEGGILSVHGDDNADYQNNTSFDAIAVLTLQGVGTGGATRHVKIWSGTVTDSLSGSTTLLWEFGQVDSTFFDASSDSLTTPPMKIAAGRYLIVENVDDSRAGDNSVKVLGLNNDPSLKSFVVERGA